MGFLEKVLKCSQWLGIFTILIGLTTVGLADVFFPSSDVTEAFNTNSLITGNVSHPILTKNHSAVKSHLTPESAPSLSRLGDLLIIMAQIISATQMVYEEKFVNKHNVPALQAVGWEGLFGFVTLGVLLFPMYFIPVPFPFGHPPRFVLEDAVDAFVQLHNNSLLVVAFTGTLRAGDLYFM